jgi:hypothetical protein
MFVTVLATLFWCYAHAFCVFFELCIEICLPADHFWSLQLYAYLPHCPDDRALRRHTLYSSTVTITESINL